MAFPCGVLASPGSAGLGISPSGVWLPSIRSIIFPEDTAHDGSPRGNVLCVCTHTLTPQPQSETDPRRFLEPPGARPGVGLLGMVLGGLTLPLVDASRKSGIVPWVSCEGWRSSWL